MKMKYLIPGVLAISLVSGALISSDSFAWPHDGSSGGYGKGYQHNSGAGMHMGSGYGHNGSMRGVHSGNRGNCGYGNRGYSINAKDVDKYDAMLEQYQDKVRPLRDQTFVKRQALEALQNATNPDVAAVTKAASDLRALENKIRDERSAFNDSVEKSFQ